MSPETGGAAAIAEPSADHGQTAAEPASSSPDTGDSLGTLAEAFREPGAREALKARAPGRDDADEEASPEESAADAALKPGEHAADARGGPSRRGAAQAIKDKDAEIDRLVAEREAERQQSAARAADLAQLTQRQQAAAKQALELIGDDREFERLQAARLRNRPLSAAEDDALDRMLVWREHAQTFWELADRGHKVETAKRLGDRIKQHGLDKETAYGADVPALVDHVAAVVEARVEARVRAESAEKIADLERRVKGLAPKAAAAGRAAPTTGGSSGAGGRMPDDDASPLEWFSAAIRDGSHRRPPPVQTRRR